MNIYSFLVTFNLPQLLTKSQKIPQPRHYIAGNCGIFYCYIFDAILFPANRQETDFIYTYVSVPSEGLRHTIPCLRTLLSAFPDYPQVNYLLIFSTASNKPFR